MFDTLRRFVSDIVGDTQPAAASDEDQARVAVAALLAFLVEADGVLDDKDRQTLEQTLATHFQLDRQAARSLVEEGVCEEEEAIDFSPSPAG